MTQDNSQRQSLSSFQYDPILKKLTVRGVKTFPIEAFDYKDELKILDMLGNHLTEIPAEISEFKKLRIAFFSDNNFKEVPRALAGCRSLEMVGLKSCGIDYFPDDALPLQLRGLILTDNALTAIPDSIGGYRSLQKLMLTGNRLKSLPDSLLNCSNLELLRVAMNQLSQPPSWLPDHPSLAWYTDSDNSYSYIPDVAQYDVKEYAWQDIQLGVKIGESAKNTVYAATLNDDQKVAVKLFGQGVTTDGAPDSDILSSLIAGDDNTVIGGLGRVVNGPDGQEGLVMKLIPDNYSLLAAPPNLVDLTRDDYSGSRRLSDDVVVRILKDISNAMELLHSKGIMHGDLYAHNILVNVHGESKLGDFGAASLYGHRTSAEQWRENMEVLAFGHLVKELIGQMNQEDDPTKFSTIVAACKSKDARDRPTFAQIKAHLSSI